MQTIPLAHLLLAFVPALIVVAVLFVWSLNSHTALYALGRMLAQLMLIGYLLNFLFESDSISLVVIVLAVMILASSWISLRTVANQRQQLLKYALLSVATSGLFILLLVTQGVLRLSPWYSASYMIPLAGMIFSSAMNSVSIAAERFYAERERHIAAIEARQIALNAALIPTINSLFAVGLVSLPGMMTGQILSGVSPLIAVRYQVMVMCMLFGASGIAAAIFLSFITKIKPHK